MNLRRSDTPVEDSNSDVVGWILRRVYLESLEDISLDVPDRVLRYHKSAQKDPVPVMALNHQSKQNK